MSTSDLLPPEVYQEFARQIPVAKYGLVAVCTMLLYDNLLSLDDEIEYMWNQRFTFVTLLFLLVDAIFLDLRVTLTENVTPESTLRTRCLHNLIADGDLSGVHTIPVNTLCKVFTTRIRILKQIIRCQSFILLEAIGTGTILTILPDMVIGMRVYALYKRSRILGAFLTIYLTAEFGVALWIYLTPKVSPVILPGPESITNSLALHACLGAPSPKLSNLQVASFQFMQTAYDTVVLLLIIAKTIKETLGQRLNSLHGIQSLIVQHGVIYYVVVFTTNFTWAMMILFATENFKYSMASIAGGLGCVSANRLTLSLRKFNTDSDTLWGDTRAVKTWKVQKRQSWIGTSTFDFSELEASSGSNSSNSYQLTLRGGLNLSKKDGL